MATWSREYVGIETCPNCKSTYRKTTIQYPARERGYFDCVVCGHRMSEWNSTTDEEYELVDRAQNPDSTDK